MANSIVATIPQYWTPFGLAVLTERSVGLAMVDKQFSLQVAQAGDQVNAYRAAETTVKRKPGTGDYTPEDVTVDAVPINLNQVFYQSVLLRDYELSLSLPDLMELVLVPRVQAMARSIDRMILGHFASSYLHHGSTANRSGKLGGLTESTGDQYIREAQQALHNMKAPDERRLMAISHFAQTELQGISHLQKVNESGRDETLRRGIVGTMYDVDFMMSQNVPYVDKALADTQTATVNNAGGYAAGTNVSMTVTDPGTDWTVGEYVVFEENGQPTFVTATGGATTVTLNENLKYAVTNGGDITHYLKCTNEATTRAAGYEESMTFTHTAAKNLQEGQIISFGTGASRHTYTIIEVSATTSTTSTVLLHKPLEAQVASGADAFPGPGGGINPITSSQSTAFVSRPMVDVNGTFGAQSQVFSVTQELGGVVMRTTTGYRIDKGAWQVNMDILCGIGTLNENLATVVYS